MSHHCGQVGVHPRFISPHTVSPSAAERHPCSSVSIRGSFSHTPYLRLRRKGIRVHPCPSVVHFPTPRISVCGGKASVFIRVHPWLHFPLPHRRRIPFVPFVPFVPFCSKPLCLSAGFFTEAKKDTKISYVSKGIEKGTRWANKFAPPMPLLPPRLQCNQGPQGFTFRRLCAVATPHPGHQPQPAHQQQRGAGFGDHGKFVKVRLTVDVVILQPGSINTKSVWSSSYGNRI